MSESTTPKSSPLELVDNHNGMTEKEFWTVMQGHVPYFVAWILRLVPEVYEMAEEVEEEVMAA